MKKNDEFVVTIEDLSQEGAGVGRQDGYIWFIKDTVIGDVVRAGVMKMKKNYGYARLIQVLEPSPARITPLCPQARQCGGCQLQMMTYEEQLRFKERKIYNNLKRLGGLSQLCLPGQAQGKPGEMEMEPIIGMENPWRYRNKAQFPFGRNKDGRIVTGFYAGHSHRIVETQDCLLGIQENQPILELVKAHMERWNMEPYDEETHEGLVRHCLIRKGFATGELMVCLVINGRQLPGDGELITSLRQIPGMTSISLNVNQEKTNVILGREVIHLWGPGYIRDQIGDVKYHISPLSFYQVNPGQTVKLYGTALEYAGLTGEETVWDLYCGIGTISLFLAQKAKMVYGVEIVPQAIEDARANAALNGMENVRFFVGKAEEVLPREYETHRIQADVVVVDPPRKGCDKRCLETIVKMRPQRVVYVSCDSATLARDIQYLGENGYQVKRVRGCDMFGASVHCECVVKLELVD